MKNKSFYTTSVVSLFKKLLIPFLIFLFSSPVHSQPATSASGWYFTSYSFKEGSLRKESVLMGTTSKMYDTIYNKGDKGNMIITHNRYDVKTGKLVAGVSYKVIWSDPPAVLQPEEKTSIDFESKTISSLSWKAPQRSVYVNQGLYGIYYITPGGEKYINKDISARLTTEKPIQKGTKGAKRLIQINFGNGFHAIYNYEWRDGNSIEKPVQTATANGWQLINYSFKDGSVKKNSVLMGTTSGLYDTISYKGDKGNIVITHNRYDVKTGKLLAGVSYKVIWSDPPAVLQPEEKTSIDFELKTISSLTWKAPQQSIRADQGLYGVYYITPGGEKYINKDIRARLTTEKPILKGTKGAKRLIQINFGNGFSATYTYEWR